MEAGQKEHRHLREEMERAQQMARELGKENSIVNNEVLLAEDEVKRLRNENLMLKKEVKKL